MLTGQIALIIAALFTGAALAISIAEHPARLALDDEDALRQWRASYKRAKPMQAALALAGGALALWIWWHSLNQLWLIGGLLLIANWPFTLLAIAKVNRRLGTGGEGAETRALLEKWGRLHAVRTALGASATLVMFCALHWRL